MRLAISFIPLLLIVLGSFNFQPAKTFVPPGTVKINDTLYFDKTEITNLDWREYENWTKQNYGDSSAEYKKTIPDTLVWAESLSPESPYSEPYHNAAFIAHPVVGISYEQAVNYCKWRTERVKQKDKRSLSQELYYRLPTKQEWEAVASAGYDEKWQKAMNSKKWECHQFFNLISFSDSINACNIKPNPSATITAPAVCYAPNRYGIFNLFGNVAEMTSEKGIAKGGGWNTRESQATVKHDFLYDAPKAWLGFRCVCVVK